VISGSGDGVRRNWRRVKRGCLFSRLEESGTVPIQPDLLLLKSVIKLCEEKSVPFQSSRSLIRYCAHILPGLMVSYAADESDLTPTETARRLSMNFCGN